MYNFYLTLSFYGSFMHMFHACEGCVILKGNYNLNYFFVLSK